MESVILFLKKIFYCIIFNDIYYICIENKNRNVNNY